MDKDTGVLPAAKYAGGFCVASQSSSPFFSHERAGCEGVFALVILVIRHIYDILVSRLSFQRAYSKEKKYIYNLLNERDILCTCDIISFNRRVFS